MNQPLSAIHLIFKTHLDIGFTDYARRVVDTYFDVFIPKAIETARWLRQEGRTERFIWTTGSWLVYEFLERADSSRRKRMEAAIAAGDLVWHGLPFTMHSELMDPSLFRYGLSLSQQLDRRFGKQTIAAKMTDVPGHTRGIVPLLAEAGIRFLHIGVNPASTPPDVPPVFVWKDGGARVVVMYHKGSYGDLTIVPGLPEGLAFAHTGDNLGPQSPQEVAQAYRQLEGKFPGARVMASTLDAFAAKLLSVEHALPIVTGELGDTWIHGVGTDPGKVSRFRELCRLRREWLESGKASLADPRFAAFSRSLLMIPEHTWGLDEKTHLHDYVNYDAERLQAARKTEKFRAFEASWAEQRAYLDDALTALGDSPLAGGAKASLGAIAPARPAMTGFSKITDVTEVFDTPRFQIGFDGRDGAINHLVDRTTGRRWASPRHKLALFSYETFCQQDYDRFWRQYIINKRQTAIWSRDDFTKPGIESAVDAHRVWQPQLACLYVRRSPSGITFLAELAPPDESVIQFGCPRHVVVEIDLPEEQPALKLNVQWFDKQACRLPEAVWFSFCPPIMTAKGWTLDKLGRWISPLEVVRNGNRKLHAVNSGAVYSDVRGRLTIETLDTPLVAPGEPSLLNFNNRQPPLRKGLHFNLYNNVWGTNFPMWYDEDARFRFVLHFDAV